MTPGGHVAAWAGAVNPAIQVDLGQRAFLAEIDLDVLREGLAVVPRYSPLPKLTEVSRDLSLVVKPGTSYASILRALEAVATPVPVRFEAIDRYEGPPLKPGQSSLTVRATLTPSERTLKEDEIDGYRRALIDALKRDLEIDIRGK